MICCGLACYEWGERVREPAIAAAGGGGSAGGDRPQHPAASSTDGAAHCAPALHGWHDQMGAAAVRAAAIAAWPEISRITDHSRVAFRRALQLEVDSGLMRSPRYHGVDQRGRPYTITATTANQTSPERVALVDPKADLTTEAGSWVMVQAQEGVFIQHQSLLDLSKEVTLYREDGTMLSTDTAAMDLKAGAGTSSDKTHAEGPFGTLDAQGFTMTEKGSVIQFQGASHAILNAADAKPTTPAPTPATAEAPAR
jgi:lipopolysaccharide export system protein LptC